MKPAISRKYDVIIITLLAAVYFIALKFHQFAAFSGIGAEFVQTFETTLWNSVNGRFMIVHTGESFFSGHFSPIMIMLIPVYYAFQSPYTLLAIQGAACALAVVPLYYLAARYFESRMAPALICVCYFCSRAVNYGLMYEFHMEIFYPLFFFTLFLLLEKRKWVWFFAFLFLCLFVKEDAAVAVTGLGLYMLFTDRKKYGLITAAIGIFWLVAVIYIIIPLFGSSNLIYQNMWGAYGNTKTEIFLNMLNPLRQAEILFTKQKLLYSINLFSVFLFLPLFNWRTLLFLILPLWYIMYSSGYVLMNVPQLYYGLLITPFLFYAAIINLNRLNSPRRTKVVLALVILMAVVNIGNSRLTMQLFKPGFWNVEARYDTAHEIIRNLPPVVKIEAQDNLIAHVPPYHNRLLFQKNSQEGEYIFLDTKGGKWPLTEEEYKIAVDSITVSPSITVLVNKDDFLLLKRK